MKFICIVCHDCCILLHSRPYIQRKYVFNKKMRLQHILFKFITGFCNQQTQLKNKKNGKRLCSLNNCTVCLISFLFTDLCLVCATF